MAGVRGADGLPTLRLLTCGSVDDGKSTLIGRLLYEGGMIPDDQLEILAQDSRKHGSVGSAVDFALLVDGLEAEREQGITIDVAYRYFATPARAFIVADTPGHEQYTRNMATGASNAELAILLVDARKGVLPQTRRHAAIVSMLGIRHVVLAVNKMDMIDYERDVFDAIVSNFGDLAKHLKFEAVQAIPISALRGDNVTARSASTPWYDGPCLLDYIERVDVGENPLIRPLRMPIQWVNRPHQDFRGLAGTIVSGALKVGDAVVVAASGRTASVARIVTMDGDRLAAEAPDSVTLTLTDEIDVSRGDLLSGPTDRPEVADQFAAHLLWMSEETLLPGRRYWLKINSRTLSATVTEIKHKLDFLTLADAPAKTLAFNDVGFCNISSAAPIAFDAYATNRATGAFILIDRVTHATAAAGMIDFGLRRAHNIPIQDVSVSRQIRAKLKQQKPVVLWFTGLSGSGKSTVANRVDAKLTGRNLHTAMLDGDNIRHGLNRDLGFTEVDRVENIRRTGEVARLMTDAGLIVLCSFISPFRADRQFVRDLLPAGEFVEIFLDTPLEICIARDAKGLYKRALAGEIRNFTGIDQSYERPQTPELSFDSALSADEAADRVVAWLEDHAFIDKW